MELFYKVDDWKVDEMSPDELLQAHENINKQIDRLKAHWTELNRAQTKIMRRFYELEMNRSNHENPN